MQIICCAWTSVAFLPTKPDHSLDKRYVLCGAVFLFPSVSACRAFQLLAKCTLAWLAVAWFECIVLCYYFLYFLFISSCHVTLLCALCAYKPNNSFFFSFLLAHTLYTLAVFIHYLACIFLIECFRLALSYTISSPLQKAECELIVYCHKLVRFTGFANVDGSFSCSHSTLGATIDLLLGSLVWMAYNLSTAMKAAQSTKL